MNKTNYGLGNGIGVYSWSFGKMLIAVLRFFFGTPLAIYIWGILLLILITIGLFYPFGYMDTRLG